MWLFSKDGRLCEFSTHHGVTPSRYLQKQQTYGTGLQMCLVYQLFFCCRWAEFFNRKIGLQGDLHCNLEVRGFLVLHSCIRMTSFHLLHSGFLVYLGQMSTYHDGGFLGMEVGLTVGNIWHDILVPLAPVLLECDEFLADPWECWLWLWIVKARVIHSRAKSRYTIFGSDQWENCGDMHGTVGDLPQLTQYCWYTHIKIHAHGTGTLRSVTVGRETVSMFVWSITISLA